MKKGLYSLYIILGIIMIVIGVYYISETRTGFEAGYLGNLIFELNIPKFICVLFIYLGIKNCLYGFTKICETINAEEEHQKIVSLLAEISRKMSVNNISNSQDGISNDTTMNNADENSFTPYAHEVTCPNCGFMQPTGSTRCVKCSSLLNN